MTIEMQKCRCGTHFYRETGYIINGVEVCEECKIKYEELRKVVRK